jgi:hypothetical protein
VTVTSDGAAIGLIDSDNQGNPSHCRFLSVPGSARVVLVGAGTADGWNIGVAVRDARVGP